MRAASLRYPSLNCQRRIPAHTAQRRLSSSTQSTQTQTPQPSSAATVSSTKQADSSPTKTAQSGKPAIRKHKIPTSRPNIFLTNPRKWHPPLRMGFLPAYDEALKLIQDDSLAIKTEIRGLKDSIKKTLDPSSPQVESAQKEKLEVLEVQSKINLPSVRWNFANGLGDMSKSVYRQLAEQRWRTTGALDLLMERVHQMNVVPDLLPTIKPSFEVRVTFPEGRLRTRVGRKYVEVEPGVFLLPAQTRRPPRLYTSVFHPEPRYYTMLLIDADVPDPANKTFTTYLHWMQPNIPLSATSTSPIPTYPHTRYIPPHPQRGSPYHRYCLLFLPHANPIEKVTIPVVSDSDRLGFNVRELSKQYEFDMSKGGAIHMWREVWDETVSDICSNTLNSPEHLYGLSPKQDPYVEVKRLRKYAN